MQTIDLEMSKDLSDALFNPRQSSLLRGTGHDGCNVLRRIIKGRQSRGWVVKAEVAPGRGGNSSLFRGPSATMAAASAAHQPPDAPEPLSLANRIERMGRALTADELAEMLTVSRITVFKLAKAGRIPCFRIGTCVRFDPRAVANWLRKM